MRNERFDLYRFDLNEDDALRKCAIDGEAADDFLDRGITPRKPGT